MSCTTHFSGRFIPAATARRLTRWSPLLVLTALTALPACVAESGWEERSDPEALEGQLDDQQEHPGTLVGGYSLRLDAIQAQPVVALDPVGYEVVHPGHHTISLWLDAEGFEGPLSEVLEGWELSLALENTETGELQELPCSAEGPYAVSCPVDAPLPGHGPATATLEASYEGEAIRPVAETPEGYLYLPIPGDANFDGFFDDADLVVVMIAGLYETGLPATFEEGDFNADGYFDSEDLVAAWMPGNYLAADSRAPTPAESSEDLETTGAGCAATCWLEARVAHTESHSGSATCEDGFFQTSPSGSIDVARAICPDRPDLTDLDAYEGGTATSSMSCEERAHVYLNCQSADTAQDCGSVDLNLDTEAYVSDDLAAGWGTRVSDLSESEAIANPEARAPGHVITEGVQNTYAESKDMVTTSPDLDDCYQAIFRKVGEILDLGWSWRVGARPGFTVGMNKPLTQWMDSLSTLKCLRDSAFVSSSNSAQTEGSAFYGYVPGEGFIVPGLGADSQTGQDELLLGEQLLAKAAATASVEGGLEEWPVFIPPPETYTHQTMYDFWGGRAYATPRAEASVTLSANGDQRGLTILPANPPSDPQRQGPPVRTEDEHSFQFDDSYTRVWKGSTVQAACNGSYSSP